MRRKDGYHGLRDCNAQKKGAQDSPRSTVPCTRETPILEESMNVENSLQRLSELGFRGMSHTKSVTSSVTTAWGVNWDAELVARDLMQNFFDADRHRVSEINVELDRDTIRVSSPTPYNLERLYFLGSEKGPDDVGKYGEGFKAAATCVLREHGSVMAAASENQVVRIRIDSKPVEGTNLYPLVYDFFTSKSRSSGNVLFIRGASQKLARAMEHGLDHFFFVGNRLIGNEIASHGRDFVVYQSTTPDGHIFYRNLKRGGIPSLPLVLVLNKEYAAIEKKIASDRDRNAFGEELRKLFYSVWARSFFKGWKSRERIAVEAARNCWERGAGHPLLAEIASYGRPMSGWDTEAVRDVFGGQVFCSLTGKRRRPATSLSGYRERLAEAGAERLAGLFRKVWSIVR